MAGALFNKRGGGQSLSHNAPRVPDVHERCWSIYVDAVVSIARKKFHDGVKEVNVAQAQAWPLPFADTRSGYPLLKDVVGFDEKKIFFCKLSMTKLICGAAI